MKAKSLAGYSDVVPVLQAAKLAGGAKFECASPGAATRWIARANAARKIDRELRAETRLPGEPFESRWDGLRLSKPDRASSWVIISVREAPTSVLDLNGQPLPISPVEEEAIYPLLETARKLGL